MDKKAKDSISQSVERFLSWLEINGFYSYDVYDIWSSSLGIYAKLLFNDNKLIATPLVGLLQLGDSFLPQLRYLFAKKKRFPLADAQLASGYLNYYKYTKNGLYLRNAELLLDNLIATAYKTRNGIGWGLPYKWVTLLFNYEPNVPLITVTPYCFFAFYDAYEITKNQKYLKILKDIAGFVAHDMRETVFEDGSIGSSYGTDDPSLVYNAIAYRSAVLLKAGLLFNTVEYLGKAKANINYVIAGQNNDGSWYYSSDSKFIDNFHTCFVLKNIAENYKYFNDPRMKESLIQGFEFYKNNFIREDGTLKHFYKSKYPKFRKVELYDYAEGIKLGIALKSIDIDAHNYAVRLSNKLISEYQTQKGYYITRINLLGGKHKIPYLRWPQSQLFNALTLLLISD